MSDTPNDKNNKKTSNIGALALAAGIAIAGVSIGNGLRERPAPEKRQKIALKTAYETATVEHLDALNVLEVEKMCPPVGTWGPDGGSVDSGVVDGGIVSCKPTKVLGGVANLSVPSAVEGDIEDRGPRRGKQRRRVVQVSGELSPKLRQMTLNIADGVRKTFIAQSCSPREADAGQVQDFTCPEGAKQNEIQVASLTYVPCATSNLGAEAGDKTLCVNAAIAGVVRPQKPEEQLTPRERSMQRRGAPNDRTGFTVPLSPQDSAEVTKAIDAAIVVWCSNAKDPLCYDADAGT